jgi:hypothetical protein
MRNKKNLSQDGISFIPKKNQKLPLGELALNFI